MEMIFAQYLDPEYCFGYDTISSRKCNSIAFDRRDEMRWDEIGFII